jgi:hypothetical protein
MSEAFYNATETRCSLIMRSRYGFSVIFGSEGSYGFDDGQTIEFIRNQENTFVQTKLRRF